RPARSYVLVMNTLGQMWRDLASLRAPHKVDPDRGVQDRRDGATLYVCPKQELIDYPTKIVVNGLRPLQTIVLTVRSTDAAGLTWTSSLGYWASGKGEVNPANQAIRLPPKYSSLKDWAGLFHAMAPNRIFMTGEVY